MKLALKIDVSTLRGLREGVPALVELLRKHGAGATFFFATGPDRSGRLGRGLAPGTTGGLREQRGFPAALYGTLLPSPELGRRGAEAMLRVRDAGFETGVASWDAATWRRCAAHADAAWTDAAMQHAVDEYTRIFGGPPHTHAASGWQTNAHALRATQRLGFAYCSDGRGRSPHLPVANAELIRCPQFPTTLPLLDECLGEAGVTPDTLASHLLGLTGAQLPPQPVFALRAEIEGVLLARVLDQLFTGWRAQGYELVPLAALHASVEPLALARCEVALAPLPPRAHPLLLQGDEFLADAVHKRAA